MMNMLKSGLKSAEDAANTVANVGKAAAAGVVGSIKSAAEGGRVTVRFAQPFYTSGDVVEGWVDVLAKIPFIAKGIDVKISGYEKTEWHERSERIAAGAAPGAAQVGIPVYTRNRGKKVLFETKIRVHDMNNAMLPAGQHSFPFKWQLPASLPGSFYDRVALSNVPASAEFKERDLVADWFDSDDEDANARHSSFGTVHYKVKAFFDVVDALWMKDMAGKSTLLVRPRLDATGAPFGEMSQDLAGCCGKAGTVSVSARFNKPSYVVGEVADVRAEVNNDTPNKYKNVVTLQRTLTLRGQGGVERKVVDKQNQPQVIYPEFAPKGKVTDCSLPLQLNGPSCRPTTAGSLVACSFEYQINVGPTTLRLPVVLHAAQPQQQPGSPMSPNAGAVAPL